MSQILPLELLSSGEEGEVLTVDGHRELITRLAEIGLREGAHVRMVRPGSPCIIALGNHRLSFRADDAASVLVAVGSNSLTLPQT